MSNKAFDPKILIVPLVLALVLFFYFVPGYQQIEAKTRYPDFQGLAPESHSLDNGNLDMVLKNSLDQPVRINSIYSEEECVYAEEVIGPSGTLRVICGNFNGRLSLSYSVAGMDIEVSGRIPE